MHAVQYKLMDTACEPKMDSSYLTIFDESIEIIKISFTGTRSMKFLMKYLLSDSRYMNELVTYTAIWRRGFALRYDVVMNSIHS